MKQHISRFFYPFTTLLLVLILPACDLFQYHPYQGKLKYKNLTAQNVDRIKALEGQLTAQTTLRFAFISDTQGYFAETKHMVEDINRRDVAFVLHGGDLTNFAFTDEFERMHEELAKLKMPYVSVIGNHDCLGDGAKIYQEMYGPLNHSFTLGPHIFIFLNTNYLEFDGNVPDLNWLERELNTPPSVRNKFVLSHISPNNPDANPAKEQGYARLMRLNNVALSLHGHTHGYQVNQLYDDGITYLTTSASLKRSYVIITVTGTQVTFEKVDF